MDGVCGVEGSSSNRLSVMEVGQFQLDLYCWQCRAKHLKYNDWDDRSVNGRHSMGIFDFNRPTRVERMLGEC